MINRLPWRKKLRTSAANNLDKINEIVDYINHSDISPVTLSDSASGRVVDVGMASSMKGLEVFGESVQNGVPTPDVPVPIQVVRGRNLLDEAHLIAWNSLNYLASSSNGTSVDYSTKGAFEVEPSTDYVLSLSSFFGDGKVYFWQADGTAISNAAIDSNGIEAFTTPANCAKVSFYAKVATDGSATKTSAKPQLELGSTATPYVPYGHVGLSVTAGGTTTVTPIPLPSKGFAASLPDGTRDVLAVDSAGRWEWTSATGEATLQSGAKSVSSNGYFLVDLTTPDPGDSAGYSSIANLICSHLPASSRAAIMTSPYPAGIAYQGAANVGVWIGTGDTSVNTAELANAWLAERLPQVLYKMKNPTTESGYIDLPALPDGATVTIEATITPEFDLSWWSYQDITDMIADLKAYTDWKVSQVEGASTLGKNRLDVNPVVKEIAEIGKIEEVPAEVPEEIEDTEVE